MKNNKYIKVMDMYKLKITIISLVVIILFIGCSEQPVEPETETGRINIALVLPYSGDCGAFGRHEEKAVRLALNEINTAGGLLGRKVALITLDSQSEPFQTEMSARELMTDYDNIVAFIGTEASAASAALLEVAKEREVIQISGSSGASYFDDSEDNGLFFRTAPNEEQQANIMANKATELGLDSLAVVYIDDLYGENVAARFENQFGGTILKKVAYSAGKTSYAAVIDSLLNCEAIGVSEYDTSITVDTTVEPPETNLVITPTDSATILMLPRAIVLIGYPTSAAAIVRDWVATGYETQWILSDALKADEFVANAGPTNLEGAFGVAPYNDNTNYERFRDAYETQWGLDPRKHKGLANWYDAMILLAFGIECAGTLDVNVIKDSLVSISKPPGRKINIGEFQTGLEVLRTDSTVNDTLKVPLKINYEGASGAVDLDGNGHASSSNFEIWEIKNGEIVHLEETSP